MKNTIHLSAEGQEVQCFYYVDNETMIEVLDFLMKAKEDGKACHKSLDMKLYSLTQEARR